MNTHHICQECQTQATWKYAPAGSERYHCDAHVPRGCSCQEYVKHDSDNGREEGNIVVAQMHDEDGRLLPCVDYDYRPEGFELNPSYMVYMDDLRPTPEGWARTFTVEETIEFLRSRCVTHLSLDNDLGEGQQEGYKVMDWLEEQVFNDKTFPIPIITIHSSNSSRVCYMHNALESIERIRQQQVGGE